MHAKRYIMLFVVVCAAALAVSATASASAVSVPGTGICDDSDCYNYSPLYGDGYYEFTEDTSLDYVSSNCRRATAGIRRVNMFGWTMWRYRQQVIWCWSGNTITYIN